MKELILFGHLSGDVLRRPAILPTGGEILYHAGGNAGGRVLEKAGAIFPFGEISGRDKGRAPHVKEQLLPLPAL